VTKRWRWRKRRSCVATDKFCDCGTGTVGTLVAMLEAYARKYGKNARIAVCDRYGVPRQVTYIDQGPISTELLSRGGPIDW